MARIFVWDDNGGHWEDVPESSPGVYHPGGVTPTPSQSFITQAASASNSLTPPPGISQSAWDKARADNARSWIANQISTNRGNIVSASPPPGSNLTEDEWQNAISAYHTETKSFPRPSPERETYLRKKYQDEKTTDEELAELNTLYSFSGRMKQTAISEKPTGLDEAGKPYRKYGDDNPYVSELRATLMPMQQYEAEGILTEAQYQDSIAKLQPYKVENKNAHYLSIAISNGVSKQDIINVGYTPDQYIDSLKESENLKGKAITKEGDKWVTLAQTAPGVFRTPIPIISKMPGKANISILNNYRAGIDSYYLAEALYDKAVTDTQLQALNFPQPAIDQALAEAQNNVRGGDGSWMSKTDYADLSEEDKSSFDSGGIEAVNAARGITATTGLVTVGDGQQIPQKGYWKDLYNYVPGYDDLIANPVVSDDAIQILNEQGMDAFAKFMEDRYDIGQRQVLQGQLAQIKVQKDFEAKHILINGKWYSREDLNKASKESLIAQFGLQPPQTDVGILQRGGSIRPSELTPEQARFKKFPKLTGYERTPTEEYNLPQVRINLVNGKPEIDTGKVPITLYGETSIPIIRLGQVGVAAMRMPSLPAQIAGAAMLIGASGLTALQAKKAIEQLSQSENYISVFDSKGRIIPVDQLSFKINDEIIKDRGVFPFPYTKPSDIPSNVESFPYIDLEKSLVVLPGYKLGSEDRTAQTYPFPVRPLEKEDIQILDPLGQPIDAKGIVFVSVPMVQTTQGKTTVKVSVLDRDSPEGIREVMRRISEMPKTDKPKVIEGLDRIQAGGGTLAIPQTSASLSHAMRKALESVEIRRAILREAAKIQATFFNPQPIMGSATGVTPFPIYKTQAQGINQIQSQINTMPIEQTQPKISTMAEALAETQTKSKTQAQARTAEAIQTKISTMAEALAETQTQTKAETQAMTQTIPMTQTLTQALPLTQTLTQALPLTQTQTRTQPAILTQTAVVPSISTSTLIRTTPLIKTAVMARTMKPGKPIIPPLLPEGKHRDSEVFLQPFKGAYTWQQGVVDITADMPSKKLHYRYDPDERFLTPQQTIRPLGNPPARAVFPMGLENAIVTKRGRDIRFERRPVRMKARKQKNTKPSLSKL